MHIDVTALPLGPDAFAAANGMSYRQSAPASGFSGALFDYLQQADYTEVFRSGDGPEFEVGRVDGTAGGSQSQSAGSGITVTTSFSSSSRHSHGYLALRLDRRLPHFVLDATANDRRGSSIPMPIAGGQRLSLEGDFDKHFLLHVPAGYERDALYVFTPDLMALLIDETGSLDVEIVDDWLFVYSPKPFDLESAEVWQRLARIIDVVGTLTLRQTSRYADDRAAGATPDTVASSVAADGQRLNQGFLGMDAARSPKRMIGIVIAAFAGVLILVGVVGAFIFNAVIQGFGGG